MDTDKLVEALASGAVNYGAVYLILGNYGTVALPGGMEVSPAAGMALTVASADLAASYIADEVEKMNSADQFDESIRGAIKPAMTGLASVAAGRLLIGQYADTAAMAKVAGLGAGSSVGGKYIADMVPK